VLRAAAQRRKLELAARLSQDRKPDGGPGPIPGGTPGPAGSVNWTPLGPSVASFSGASSPSSGRVRSLAVGPSGTRVYAGAANGGLWFTADGGTTWVPLDDYTSSPTPTIDTTEADALSVGAIAVRFGASAASDLVYVGTGEPTGNYDAYLGVGIRRSASGGASGTWTLEATALAGTSVAALAIDPDNAAGDIVYAGTGRGLYRRSAGGSWTQVVSATFTNSSAVVSDVVIAGSGAAKRIYVAFSGDHVYSSPDGTTWTLVAGLTGTGRIRLAVAESAPGTLYAWRADATLCRLNAGTFYPVAGAPPASTVGQGWYDLAVGVDPSNANVVYLVGTWPLFKGTVTGSAGSYNFGFNPANAGSPGSDPTWVGNGIHSDGHAIGFALNAGGTAHDPNIVWVGTDGGVFRSTSGGANNTFSARNTGLAITEYGAVPQRWDTDAVIYAGAQDNGTQRFIGEAAWLEVQGGDGGGTAVDQNAPVNVIRQYVRASLNRSIDGGQSWSGVSFPPTTAATTDQTNAATAESSGTGFVAPIRSTPHGVATTMVGFGTNRLWVSSDWGSSWVTLPTGTNPYGPAIPLAGQDVIDGSAITAIAFASDSSVFAATSATLWHYQNSGGSWTRTVLPSAGLPAFRYITDISVADPVAGTCYISLGYSGSPHVYYWDGASWHPAMPTSVIDVPTHAVAVDPDHPDQVYVGTDVGCFRGQFSAGPSWTWTVYSAGLPECAITDLAVHQRARLLRAATHGRGVWEITLDATAASDPDLYLRVNAADTGRIVSGARFGWVEGAQDPYRPSANVYHWMSADIKVRRGSLAGLPALPTPVDYLAFATEIGDYVDSTTDIETADTSGADRIFVEVHNRSLTPVAGSAVRVLALVTDASLGLPALPANYASHLTAGDTSAGWLAGSNWRFLDPAQPYKSPPGEVNVRTPGVVEFTFDFASLSLPGGHDHVCIAAFVTTAADPLTASTPSLDDLTMHDKHVAHRNLHLVTAGATPGTVPGDGSGQSPQTFLVDIVNAARKQVVADIVFERGDFPGRIGLLLPKELAKYAERDKDLRTLPIEKAESYLGPGWLEAVRALVADGRKRPEQLQRQVARLGSLDLSQLHLVAEVARPMLRGLPLEAGQRFPAAIVVVPPEQAKVGDRYQLTLIQQVGKHIVGGSTYLIAMTKTAGRF
jgi:hypothetical protein